MAQNRQQIAFSQEQLLTVNQAVFMAEELVSEHYKMSGSQWLRQRYDIVTLSDLVPEEIVSGPFAQIIRYEGKRKGASLGSELYDFYKICLQDHAILRILKERSDLALLPLCLYVISHELIHIVRFSKFLQNFNASEEEKLAEERRVHDITHHILSTVNLPQISAVLNYFHQWRVPLEDMGPGS
jgi:hypothetical protein